MDKIFDLITLSDNVLAKILTMISSSVIPYFFFNLMPSFISGAFPLNSSSSSFSCSLPRFSHNHQFHLENHRNHKSSHHYHQCSLPYF